MENATCLIPLTQSKFAIVSPEDFEYLNQFKWHACKRKSPGTVIWYAMHVGPRPGRQMFLMHRVVAIRAGMGESRYYDHINHDGLDNRRDNIRPCTARQNVANSRKQAGTINRYKGVQKIGKKYAAKIAFCGKQIYLGIFAKEEDAATAYADAAEYLHGEFAFAGSTVTQTTKQPLKDS